MANKTQHKIIATLEITRTNDVVLERDINLTAIVQNAVLDHLSAEYSLTPAQVNALVASWRIHTIRIDEPEV